MLVSVMLCRAGGRPARMLDWGVSKSTESIDRVVRTGQACSAFSSRLPTKRRSNSRLCRCVRRVALNLPHPFMRFHLGCSAVTACRGHLNVCNVLTEGMSSAQLHGLATVYGQLLQRWQA